MEKRTMRDYVYLTPSVLRQQLAGQWEEPLAADMRRWFPWRISTSTSPATSTR